MATIEHIVVLMLENRSYDFLFGYLGVGDGVIGDQEAKNVYKGVCYPATENAGDLAPYSPGHQFSDVALQIFNGGSAATMHGFVCDAATGNSGNPWGSPIGSPMDLLSPELAPAITTLATTFTLFDRWFSSMPGPTWPNRLFAHCATSGGSVSGNFGDFPNGNDLRTIQSILDAERGSSATPTWQVYQSSTTNPPYPCVLGYLNPCVHGHQNSYNGTSFATWDALWSTLAGEEGAAPLPSYSWVYPLITTDMTGGNSMHATECISCGDAFVARLYNALRGSTYWDSTLLIITFDEHGGYYDHVSPPPAVPPDGYTESFTFDRLGVRVPAIAISQYSAQQVISTIMDHTSIIATVRECFAPDQPAINKRDAAAASVLSFLGTARSDTPTTITSVPKADPSCTCATD